MADQLGLEAQKIDENVFIFNHGAGYEEIFDIIIECLDGYEVTEEKVDDELFELYAEKKKRHIKSELILVLKKSKFPSGKRYKREDYKKFKGSVSRHLPF
ncbi:MAG: hypothetical protein A3J63_01090 [Candidatus Moranbacteria bacterium RIFCSPHIGHO2_02_FULL_40_12b]|nr:MAG: hypothetical protein A3J63_01090 [Candidatus Moranbacteria bacterium RIFCSPHIGHO2_02_FULL_40_12b]